MYDIAILGSGPAGLTAAIYSAVMDALKPMGISSLDMPLTPERVWRAIQSSDYTGNGHGHDHGHDHGHGHNH